MLLLLSSDPDRVLPGPRAAGISRPGIGCAFTVTTSGLETRYVGQCLAAGVFGPSVVVFQLQLLLFSGLAFFIMLDLLKRTETITLDFDWIYRKLMGWVTRGLNDGSERAWDRFLETADTVLTRVNSGIYRHHGPDGVFGRTWPTGRMAFWTTVMLGAYVVWAYI